MQATEKRLAGNAEARGGNLQRAVELYTEGIEQEPPSGVHMLYSNRAGARLASGDKIGAINDANAAAALSPEGFHTAYIRQACPPSSGDLFAQDSMKEETVRQHLLQRS